MVVIEIPPNSNCDAVDMRVFNDLEPPRPVSRVCLERERGLPRWYEVVAWMASGATRQALAQKVEDSGEGVAFLIYGGDAGLRLRPAGSIEPWQLAHPQQWGLPFILTTDVADVKWGPTFEKNP